MGKLIDGAGYLGNYPVNAGSIYFSFVTCDKNGGIVSPGSGQYRIYRDDNTTEQTSNISSSSPYVGLHLVTLTVSSAPTFYIAGYDYSVAYCNTIIDSEAVSGIIATFSIDNRT